VRLLEGSRQSVPVHARRAAGHSRLGSRRRRHEGRRHPQAHHSARARLRRQGLSRRHPPELDAGVRGRAARRRLTVLSRGCAPHPRERSSTWGPSHPCSLRSPMNLTTPLSRKLGLKYPFVAAPMFLISNREMIVASAEAGILGCMPSLNARTPEKLKEDLAFIRERTDKPFGINLTIGLTAKDRLEEDFALCVE